MERESARQKDIKLIVIMIHLYAAILETGLRVCKDGGAHISDGDA